MVNFLCKRVSPCHEKEAKPDEKDADEEEETSEGQKKEETEEILVNISELDVESFQRLVVSARSVANTRPSNLAKYTTLPGQQTAEGKSVNRSLKFCKGSHVRCTYLCIYMYVIHTAYGIYRNCIIIRILIKLCRYFCQRVMIHIILLCA